MAGGLTPGAPRSDPGDRHRLDSRPRAGDRRDRAADPHRSAHLHFVQPNGDGPIHGTTGADIQLDEAPGSAIQVPCRRGDHRSPDHGFAPERRGDLAPQSLSEEVVTIIESPVQVAQQQARELPPPEQREVVFDVSALTVSYGESPALMNV